MYRALPRILLLTGLAALAGMPLLQAKADADLARTSPVPADQQIPIVDFLRPARLFGPKLNPAGTHFSALFSNENDRVDLMIFNLAEKKMQVSSAASEKDNRLDISRVEWLSNSRLLFSVTKDKLYSKGLVAVEIDKLQRPIALVRNSAVQLVSLPRAERSHPIIWIRQDAADGATTPASCRSTAAMPSEHRPSPARSSHPPSGIIRCRLRGSPRTISQTRTDSSPTQ